VCVCVCACACACACVLERDSLCVFVWLSGAVVSLQRYIRDTRVVTGKMQSRASRREARKKRAVACERRAGEKEKAASLYELALSREMV
jgi:hypothetical protein